MRPELIAATHPETKPENIVKGDSWRISVLTESLLRLEYSPEGVFEDRATQSVWNRDFPVSAFQRIETEDSLEIITAKAHLIYNKKRIFTQWSVRPGHRRLQPDARAARQPPTGR